MLQQIYASVMNWTESAFGRVADGPAWLVRGVILAILISLFMSFPRISFFLGNDPQIISNWPFIERQAAAPLSTSVEADILPESHGAKRAFRLTMPLMMRFLHVDWRGILVIQFCLGVVMLMLIGKIAMDLFGDRITAIATVFGVASIYAGKAAFLQLGGVGDSLAFAFLTIASAFGGVVVIACAIFAACFTDERAIIAAPLVALYWVMRSARHGDPRWFNVQSVTVVATLAVVVATRLILANIYGLHVPLGEQYRAGLRVLLSTVPFMQYELPHVLAGLWLWPLVACILLVRARWWLTLAAAIAGTGAVIFVSFLVDDIDRSLAYTLPVLFVSLAIAAARQMEIRDIRSIAIVGFIISFMFPVNSLLIRPSFNRYSESNLFPVELVRFLVRWAHQ